MLMDMLGLGAPKCWNMFDVDCSPKCCNNMFNIFAHPYKQDKQHKPRKVKTQPAAATPPPEPLRQPVATTVAMPLSMPFWQLPFASVSPLPMQQLGYFPPRF